MNKINLYNILKQISNTLHMDFKGEILEDKVVVRPRDLEYGTGFSINISWEWRYLKAEFHPDSYSTALIYALSNADISQKEIFKQLVLKQIAEKNRIEFYIDGQQIDLLEAGHWERAWGSFGMRIVKQPFYHSEKKSTEIEEAVAGIGTEMLGIIMTLLPTEEESNDEQILNMPEGAKTKIEVNKYERSSVNRYACVSLQGHECKVCNFNFEEKFGSLGKEYIHIHHVVPVSQLTPHYRVNPKTDLVPVCPNCHAMIHKRNPPYTIDELKEILKKVDSIT